MEVTQNDKLSLREAIAWALHLADTQNETLLAAMLADVLDTADRSFTK
ncbi:MAG TPA: hypothetical protein VNJ10_04560 [Sphingomonas sp.]|nr:hypothetical protein [Sphingomonas sp.]